VYIGGRRRHKERTNRASLFAQVDQRIQQFIRSKMRHQLQNFHSFGRQGSGLKFRFHFPSKLVFSGHQHEKQPPQPFPEFSRRVLCVDDALRQQDLKWTSGQLVSTQFASIRVHHHHRSGGACRITDVGDVRVAADDAADDEDDDDTDTDDGN